MSTYERGEERLPETLDLRGTACHRCGQTMRFVYTLADVGAFCSEACRIAATRPDRWLVEQETRHG